MVPLRSPKSTYVAAFLLGGLIGLLVAAPARAAEPLRVASGETANSNLIERALARPR